MSLRILASAVATFILATPAFSATAPKAGPALLEKGKTSYTTNCLTCHGDKGDGNGPAGAYMNPKPRNFSKDKFKQGAQREQIFKTISQGIKDTAMAPFGHLTEEERWGLADYVLQLKKDGAK